MRSKKHQYNILNKDKNESVYMSLINDLQVKLTTQTQLLEYKENELKK